MDRPVISLHNFQQASSSGLAGDLVCKCGARMSHEPPGLQWGEWYITGPEICPSQEAEKRESK